MHFLHENNCSLKGKDTELPKKVKDIETTTTMDDDIKYTIILQVLKKYGRGYPHFVVMNREEHCYRFNCDVCGDASGRRVDWWFASGKLRWRSKHNELTNTSPVFEAITEDHPNVFAYDHMRMHRIRYANQRVEVQIKGKTEAEMQWIDWDEGPF